jgi:hypothetical protein
MPQKYSGLVALALPHILNHNCCRLKLSQFKLSTFKLLMCYVVIKHMLWVRSFYFDKYDNTDPQLNIFIHSIT